MRSRSNSVRVAFLLLAALPTFAQSAAAPEEKTGSVEGTVVNSQTGEPVLRAHVSFRINNQTNRRFGAITTAEGKFSITGMPAGSYSAMVDRIGYVLLPDPTGKNTSLQVRPGDKKTDFQLKMQPTGAILGRVLDSSGEPVENCRVMTEAASGIAASGMTDDKGQFRLGGLSPGKYHVHATPMVLPFPVEIRTDGTKEVHHSTTYYPSSLTSKGSARVEVQAGGDVTGVDIRLVSTPILRISGTVSGMPPNTPNQNARVMARVNNSYSSSNAVVKPDGTFDMWSVDPGRYTLFAMSNNSSGQRLQTAPVTVEVTDRNVDHVELRVIPPFSLNGNLVFEDEAARNAPPPRQMTQTGQTGQTGQQTPRPAPQRRITLRDVDGGFGGGVKPADLASDDTLTFEDVPPGRYRVMLSWAGYAYIKSMRLGQTEMQNGILDLRNGASGASLTITVSSATGDITGTVSDSKGPAAGQRVVAIADEPEPLMGAMVRTAVTSAEGTYTMGRLPPGKYKIFIGDDASVNAAMNGRYMDDYEDLMEKIELHPNDKLTKDFRVK